MYMSPPAKMLIGPNLTEIRLAGKRVGHETQNKSFSGRFFGDVDSGWLRVYATTGTSSFSKVTNIRIIAKWARSDEPGSTVTYVRFGGVRNRRKSHSRDGT